jgi:signal-transduction protein with cAMP-binding, CBS, and nucleotidyltransferase domain
MKDKQLVKEMDVDWLKERYFSDLSRRVYLKKGDVLLQPGMHNERLYLIIRGLVCGYLESESGEPYEIFRSGRGHFVGVYSYFSKAHQSYSKVVAEEDTLLAYIDAEQKVAPDEEGRTFADHFLPVVVNEVYMRQLLAQKMSIEREAAMKRLFHAEKMATLGQMAAGLAHELNNAVGVINRKAEWIAERAAEYIRTRDPEGWYDFFEKGFREGQKLSTKEIRKRKRELEERFSLNSSEAKQLASIGLSDEELRPFPVI